MCGGYALAEPTEVLEDVFNVDLVGENLPGPSWNIRPTNQVPIVVDTVCSLGATRTAMANKVAGIIPPTAENATTAAKRRIASSPAKGLNATTVAHAEHTGIGRPAGCVACRTAAVPLPLDWDPAPR